MHGTPFLFGFGQISRAHSCTPFLFGFGQISRAHSRAQPNSELQAQTLAGKPSHPLPHRRRRRLRCPGRGGNGGDLDGLLNYFSVARCWRIAASRPLEPPKHAVGPHWPPS
ncbi:hypothetical protein PVAP13_5NG142500 [Panicum virgatum]|uniref:Uncharacterized protein n=1 Tax=Panicum virgatum TaxID=38727 RepID=A0A8T0RM81_PANVG|nr:hypothetical protein PVAP13_5NG142500 [Panicum virgatum]